MASPPRVVRSLAIVEGKLLLRHPAMIAGVALSLLIAWRVAVIPGGELDLRRYSIEVVLFVVPLGWTAMIAANSAALRARRHGVTELFDSLPTLPASRTLGHVLAAVVVAPVALAFVVGEIVVSIAVASTTHGSVVPAEFASAAFIAVGGAVVGVAVARWLPHPIFVLAAIAATVAIELALADSPVISPVRWLAFWIASLGAGLAEFDVRPSVWHLVWLAAATTIMGVVAVARNGMNRSLAAVAVAAFVVAGLSGFVQTRSIPHEQAGELARLLTEPEEHQTCERDSAVTFCAYPEHADRMVQWRQVVGAVLAKVPGEQPHLLVSERVPTRASTSACGQQPYPDTLPAEIGDRLEGVDLWPVDGAVHPSVFEDSMPCGGTRLDGLFTAVQTGAWAVGLPPTPADEDDRCVADGQARSAIALWLGVQAVRTGPDHLRRVVSNTPVDSDGRLHFSAVDQSGSGPWAWSDPPQWGVRWHRDDVSAALALATVPVTEVGELLAEHWAELRTPSTSTGRLLELADLDASDRSLPAGGSAGAACP